jgi:Tetratricopeptide repeat
MNELDKSLKTCLECLEIRKTLLDEDHVGLAGAYSNLAATMSALGRQKGALEYLALTEQIERKAGEAAAISLGLTLMLIGGVFFLQQQPSATLNRYRLSEEIFARTLGPRSHLMAQLAFHKSRRKL